MNRSCLSEEGGSLGSSGYQSRRINLRSLEEPQVKNRAVQAVPFFSELLTEGPKRDIEINEALK